MIYKTTSYPKHKIKILLLENISAEAVKMFKQNDYVEIKEIKGALTEAELVKAIRDVHIVGIRSKTQLSERVLQHANKLLAIGCFCIGVNQVNLNTARHRGIAVFNAPYSNTRSVAELVIGAMIMLIRKVPEKNKMAHEGVWNKEAINSHELRGKTLGIVGYGNIGSQVSVLSEALGLKVIFYDVQKKLPLGNAHAVKDLNELFSKADLISFHIPATSQTKNIINKKTLKKFKKGSILINYARGEIMDIDAVKWALNEGILSGAAIDVYADEPEKNGDAFTCSLQGYNNVLLTPHIGGSTEEAQVNIGLDVSSKLIDFIESGTSNGAHSIPALDLPMQDNTHRILHIHCNEPGVLSQINAILSKEGTNILAQYLKTNEDVGYVVLDVDKHISRSTLEQLKNMQSSIKVRVVY